MPSEIRIVLTSVDDHKAAQSMARNLVETGLAGCVQVSVAGESWFRWQGEVQHEAEFFLVIKTSEAKLESVIDWVQAQHPYELPEVVWFPAQASPGYAAWLRDQVRT